MGLPDKDASLELARPPPVPAKAGPVVVEAKSVSLISLLLPGCLVRCFECRSHTIKPADGWVQVWDFVTLVALVYVAVVTPYELAIIDGEAPWGLFGVNRVIDIIFVIDIAVNFFKQVEREGGGCVRLRCLPSPPTHPHTPPIPAPQVRDPPVGDHFQVYGVLVLG